MFIKLSVILIRDHYKESADSSPITKASNCYIFIPILLYNPVSTNDIFLFVTFWDILEI